ncbi:NAD(P)H-hydrate epimerase [Brachybacterium sp. EF45031]|uniref:NAD(P)H-hydrate epimerase n=1 Tax=Brachybacterium sillae TaxID=2810536 RepID=UPI00217D58B3|nr:NAD(P)H-hydrate epimerase [Brachybacterium sillae]MCS6711190.1 NAD(P)H-hydrate epimerase [Brachybacterium sillae]
MIRAHTGAAVRAAEQPLLQAGEPLMQRAATALADHAADALRERRLPLPQARVLVLAGPGSNGGDALLAGADLARQGAHVTAVAALGSLQDGPVQALREAGGRVVDSEATAGDLPTADLLLDGVLGTGARPDLSDDLRDLLARARAALDPHALVLAVDVPTGVDATTGAVDEGALTADATITFGAVKSGLLLPPATESCGRVIPVDIGLGPHLPAQPAVRRLEDPDVRDLWPRARRSDHKYSRGVLTVAAGSIRYPGAAVLVSEAASRTGLGMIRYRGPVRVLDLVLQRRPEVVGEDGRHDALVVGPGLPGDDPRAAAALQELREGLPGVVDAGGLDAILREQHFGPDTVLTPHHGEAVRLAHRLGLPQSVTARPAALSTALARATGATVLLKGAVTVIAPGDAPEELFSQDDATAQLAVAGAGDVLAGILGALLAHGLPGPEAAAVAALLHGRAARRASRDGLLPITALDVPAHLGEVLAAILTPAPAADRIRRWGGPGPQPGSDHGSAQGGA